MSLNFGNWRDERVEPEDLHHGHMAALEVCIWLKKPWLVVWADILRDVDRTSGVQFTGR
jgi:hypothetical protein